MHAKHRHRENQVIPWLPMSEQSACAQRTQLREAPRQKSTHFGAVVLAICNSDHNTRMFVVPKRLEPLGAVRLVWQMQRQLDWRLLGQTLKLGDADLSQHRVPAPVSCGRPLQACAHTQKYHSYPAHGLPAHNSFTVHHTNAKCGPPQPCGKDAVPSCKDSYTATSPKPTQHTKHCQSVLLASAPPAPRHCDVVRVARIRNSSCSPGGAYCSACTIVVCTGSAKCCMRSVMGPLPVSADAMQQPTKETLHTSDKQHRLQPLLAHISSRLCPTISCMPVPSVLD